MANIAKTQEKAIKPRKAPMRASRAQLSEHAPERLITYRVSVLAQLLSKLVDASVSSQLDLTSRQWRVLVILQRIGSATSGEVARTAHFDHSQVSRVAFELAGKGLITQSIDGNDRRKQILALTPAGIECLRMGLPGSLEREARLKARLSADEYECFCRALDALVDEAGGLLREFDV